MALAAELRLHPSKEPDFPGIVLLPMDRKPSGRGWHFGEQGFDPEESLTCSHTSPNKLGWVFFCFKPGSWYYWGDSFACWVFTERIQEFMFGTSKNPSSLLAFWRWGMNSKCQAGLRHRELLQWVVHLLFLCLFPAQGLSAWTRDGICPLALAWTRGLGF